MDENSAHGAHKSRKVTQAVAVGDWNERLGYLQRSDTRV